MDIVKKEIAEDPELSQKVADKLYQMEPITRRIPLANPHMREMAITDALRDQIWRDHVNDIKCTHYDAQRLVYRLQHPNRFTKAYTTALYSIECILRFTFSGVAWVFINSFGTISLRKRDQPQLPRINMTPQLDWGSRIQLYIEPGPNSGYIEILIRVHYDDQHPKANFEYDTWKILGKHFNSLNATVTPTMTPEALSSALKDHLSNIAHEWEHLTQDGPPNFPAWNNEYRVGELKISERAAQPLILGMTRELKLVVNRPGHPEYEINLTFDDVKDVPAFSLQLIKDFIEPIDI